MYPIHMTIAAGPIMKIKYYDHSFANICQKYPAHWSKVIIPEKVMLAREIQGKIESDWLLINQWHND